MFSKSIHFYIVIFMYFHILFICLFVYYFFLSVNFYILHIYLFSIRGFVLFYVSLLLDSLCGAASKCN